MADTYYAWSNILVSRDEHGQVTKSFAPGDTVAPGDAESDFDTWVEEGVLRTVPYPDLSEFGGSPMEYYRGLVDQAMTPGAEQLSVSEVKTLKDAGLVPSDVEEPAAAPKAGTATNG